MAIRLLYHQPSLLTSSTALLPLRLFSSFSSQNHTFSSDNDAFSPRNDTLLPTLQPSNDADLLSQILLHHHNPFHAMESSLQLPGISLTPFPPPPNPPPSPPQLQNRLFPFPSLPLPPSHLNRHSTLPRAALLLPHPTVQLQPLSLTI
ncbi:hypothetical protein OIU76_002736 [Salix suchowensis]|nr:hypothetical protein OIU76_002736 [Salix suchowensis]